MAAEPLQLREWNLGPKIYLGNLGENVNKFEIAELFKPYGKLKNVIVAKNPPGFAFVEFEDAKDAENAYNIIYGANASATGLPIGMQKWQPKEGSSMNIKPPTESRPEDWLCPKEGCSNVNFEWRKTCNNCNTRKPGFDGETEEERRQRIYGPRDYHGDTHGSRDRSYDRDRSRHRGRGQGPEHSRDREWDHGRQRTHERNPGRGYNPDRRGRGRRT